MTKIINTIHLSQKHSAQECYEEFISTSKLDLMQNREKLGESFESLHKNLDSLYRTDKHLVELFARIYYEVNCKFEFNAIYNFLKQQNDLSKWLNFAKNAIDEPKEFKSHFTTLVNLYENISDINEEFIYLYLKYLEKSRNLHLWQECVEKSHLADYLVQILENLPNDYISARNMLLKEFDKHNAPKIALQNRRITMEQNTKYANDLAQIRDIDFDKILAYCRDNKCHADLERGKKILQNQNELICYLGFYGLIHQAKLNASFEVLCNAVNLKDTHLNIIDYGCGQALGSCVFLDFIKKLNATINNITLIEPSSIALSRGILHLNLLGITENQIVPLNCGLDEIRAKSLQMPTKDFNIHIFSNALDLMNFRLDRAFYDKIANANKDANIFICVSPPYDNTQIRLDLFYQYFMENHNALLISHNKNDIIHSGCTRPIKRYEYVFQCNFKG